MDDYIIKKQTMSSNRRDGQQAKSTVTETKKLVSNENGIEVWECSSTVTEYDNGPIIPTPPKDPRFKTFQDWLVHVSETVKPDESAVAYNFGLLETTDGYAVFLSIGNTYSEDTDDWANDAEVQNYIKPFSLPAPQYKKLDHLDARDKVKEELLAFSNTEAFKKSVLSKATAITTGLLGDLVAIQQF